MHETTVLFVCIHNSARSQMAEAFLRELGGDRFRVESAGLEPGRLNPLAVQVMREVGIDISTARTQSAFDLFKAGRRFQYVISVCDDASAERCPVFPGVLKQRLNWSFEDPAQLGGGEEERLVRARGIRDSIRERISQWLEEMGPPAAQSRHESERHGRT